MTMDRVDALKARLQEAGFERVALLDSGQMAELIELLDQDQRSVETPSEELRYIEGLLSFPFGFIESFKVIPASGSEACKCGRAPSALDLVWSAIERQVHPREQVREALLGLRNVFELSEGGRGGSCIKCGRSILMAAYWKKGYAYA